MAMDLAEAVRRVEHLVVVGGRLIAAGLAGEDERANVEALAVVLARAQENLAAETVAKVGQLVERAKALDQPHRFGLEVTGGVIRGGRCWCGRGEFDPLHLEPGGTP